jgi:hypothetical protein
MKSAKNRLSEFVAAAVLAIALAGCTSTVAPKIVTSERPSWDGGQENSGVLGFTADNSEVITAHARDRYNGLVAVYGTNFSPALVFDSGLKPTGTNTFILDAQHSSAFSKMNRARKQGAPVWVK